MGKNWQS